MFARCKGRWTRASVQAAVRLATSCCSPLNMSVTSRTRRGGTGQKETTVDMMCFVHPYSMGRIVLLTWARSSHGPILFVQTASLQTLQQGLNFWIRGCHSSTAVSTATLRKCLDASSPPRLASSSRSARRRRHGCESSPNSSICAVEELFLSNRLLGVKLAR
jgi:hypothetical protein